MSVSAIPVAGFEGRLLPGPLEVDPAEREAIAAHWVEAVAAKPQLFDGRVLLAETAEVADGLLKAVYHETRYSTFTWLKGRDYRGWNALNVFGAAAVFSSDGAVLLGRMAAHTSNAGDVYFPCGTPDPDDLVGDMVDLEGSIVRELEEETGLAAPLVRPTGRRVAVMSDHLVACVRRFESDLDAAALAERCAAHLASERRPELDNVIFARSVADLTTASPDYVHAAVAHLMS